MAGSIPAPQAATEVEETLCTPKLRRLLAALINGDTHTVMDEVADLLEEPFEYLNGRATTDEGDQHVVIDGTPIPDKLALKMGRQVIATVALKMVPQSHND